MKYILTGDIGGTNPRLAIVEYTRNKNFKILKKYKININQNSIIQSINDFLKISSEIGLTTDIACFSVAGPIENNSCNNPTNFNFPVNDIEIINSTALNYVLVINDFEAIGEAISVIDIEKDIDNKKIITISNENGKSPMPNKTGNRGIIGPGTGLGVAYLINNGGNFIVSASEGGHAGFPHRGGLENLYSFLRNKLNIKQIGMEAFISGQGIRHLVDFFLKNDSLFHEFLKENFEMYNYVKKILLTENQKLTDKKIKLALENEANGLKIDVAEIIANLTHQNAKAHISMRLFIEFLGVGAQDVALHGLTTGGLFLVGGILPKNKDLLLSNGVFRKTFEDNWKQTVLLKKIPTYLIDDYDISFMGCAKAGMNKFS